MANKLSQSGINLIKKFEGCRLTAYLCPANKWTIGWGHTDGVKQGQVITQAQADALFLKDVQEFVDGVNKLVKVEINQNQFDALVAFSYNCGLGALENSTLLKYVNAKQFEKASAEFDRWNKGGGKVLPGLVRRRNEEQALFTKTMPVVSKPAKTTLYRLKTGTFTDKVQAEQVAEAIRKEFRIVVYVGEE